MLTTNEVNPNEWVDVEQLREELAELDKNKDIWVPEPGYQAPKSDSDVIEVEVDASGKGEAQFDWEEDSEGLVVKGADETDEEFNKEIQAIANNELDADEAFIKMYQEMLKEGRHDGDDPLKKDVALNSILNLLLEQAETGTKGFEDFINDRQINSFEDVFFEILAQGNTIIRDTKDADQQRELRMLMNILKRYKNVRGGQRRLLKELSPHGAVFAREFACGVDSHAKCRKLEEKEADTDADAGASEAETNEEGKSETAEEEYVVIDETKDLQKGIKWLLSFLPANVDDESLREIGTGIIDSSIEKIEKYEEEFEKKEFEEMQKKFKKIKEELGEGAKINENQLHSYIQSLKKDLNDKIDVLLTKENRDKEASALARVEDGLKDFDQNLREHQGNSTEEVDKLIALDHEVEDKLEGIKTQLESDDPRDTADWKAFRKNIKELINYELSNVKVNDATKKINNISQSAKNILERLGQEVDDGSLKYTSKESMKNVVDDLKALKDSSSNSGLIIDADQYKAIVKELFSPTKELLDDSGRARIRIKKDKFDNAITKLESIASKFDDKIPHTNPNKEKRRFKWVEREGPMDGKDSKTVKFKDGKRYELVEIKKTQPDYLEAADQMVLDTEDSGSDLMDEVSELIQSETFKVKMSKILDRLQKAYFFANEQTGNVLQDLNLVTRLKQGYYLHKPVARLLRSLTLAQSLFTAKDAVHRKRLARELGLKSSFKSSVSAKDADLMLYLKTRLAHSLKHNFKSRTLERAYNSLTQMPNN